MVKVVVATAHAMYFLVVRQENLAAQEVPEVVDLVDLREHQDHQRRYSLAEMYNGHYLLLRSQV